MKTFGLLGTCATYFSTVAALACEQERDWHFFEDAGAVLGCVRYPAWDLFTTYYSLYNPLMKILYISSTGYIIYMVREIKPFKTTMIGHRFLSSLAIGGSISRRCLVTSIASGFDFLEMLWYLSIFLEAIIIVPQLIVLQRYREVENLTGHYVFFLGAYRALSYQLDISIIPQTYYKHNRGVCVVSFRQPSIWISSTTGFSVPWVEVHTSIAGHLRTSQRRREFTKGGRRVSLFITFLKLCT